MKKSLLVMLAIAFATLALAACGSGANASGVRDSATTASPSQTTATTQGNGNPIVFSMQFADSNTSTAVKGGKKIAELVDTATSGAIRIDVASDDEFDEASLVEEALDNQVDIVACSNSTLAEHIPHMEILDQAYLWKSADEAHAAIDGKLGQLIKDEASALGLHVIGFEDAGFLNTFSTKPIINIDDFQGMTIRTAKNAYRQAAFEALGAKPVSLPSDEVIPALKSGQIDACENATANCLSSGYYKVTRNITNTHHSFAFTVLCMSDGAWEMIPDDMREPFLAAVQEGIEWQRARLVEADKEAVTELMGLGVSFFDIDIAELQAAYREKADAKDSKFDSEWQAAVDEATLGA